MMKLKKKRFLPRSKTGQPTKKTLMKQPERALLS